MTLLTICRTSILRNLYKLTAIQYSLPTNGMTTFHKFVVLFRMTFSTDTSNNLAIDPFILTVASTGIEIFYFLCLLHCGFQRRGYMTYLTPYTLSGMFTTLPVGNPTVRHTALLMTCNTL